MPADALCVAASATACAAIVLLCLCLLRWPPPRVALFGIERRGHASTLLPHQQALQGLEARVTRPPPATRAPVPLPPLVFPSVPSSSSC